MRKLEQVNEFEMLANAMIYVKAAAEAGGKVDLNRIQYFAFEDTWLTADVLIEKYLMIFGEVEPYPTEEEEMQMRENDDMHFTKFFTLNENGWKLAKQIMALHESIKDIAPSQDQINQWLKEEYEDRMRE